MRRLHGDSQISRAKEGAGEVVKRIVAAGSSIEVQPAGPLPFQAVAEMIATDDHSHNVNHHLSCGNSFFWAVGGRSSKRLIRYSER